MIKFQATSLIHHISPVLQVTDRFQKRELILNDSWTGQDGQPHPNFILVEFSGDRMALLDNFAPGQRVTVEVVINGREGRNGGIFHSLRGLSIYPAQQQQQGFPQQQQQGFAQQGGFGGFPQQQQQGFPQQTQQGYSQAQSYPPGANQYQQPQPPYQQYGQSPAPGADDLPFPQN